MEIVVKTSDTSALATPDFWRSKRVFVTGHTGFKGSWLVAWLAQMGADICAVSRAPDTTPNLFELACISELCDSHIGELNDAEMLRERVQYFRPDIVLHLAAQSLVRRGYREPVETFASNVMGTVHVLEAVRRCDSIRVVVNVTTDKVYANAERGNAFGEDEKLGGYDPYSASKAAAEMVSAAYRESFLHASGVALATARAGNVIGGGDWCEDRLIPDAMRAWSKGEALVLRHPNATRPWQHVLESLNGYLVLAQRLWEEPALAGAYNIGPDAAEVASVGEVIAQAQSYFAAAKVQHETDDAMHEAQHLQLDNRKAKELLGVAPRWSLEQTIQRTMQWYAQQVEGADARALCEADIAAYRGNR